MTNHKKGIAVSSDGDITLSPPTRGCNLVTILVNDAYSLNIFSHASGHASISIHPRENADKSYIDIMGQFAEFRKRSVRGGTENDGFDCFEIKIKELRS